MAWHKWTQMDNNHRITEKPGLEQTWKIIWFQQLTTQSWCYSSTQDGTAYSSRNGKTKRESLFYKSLLFHKPLMLWCFMVNISAGRESILAGAEGTQGGAVTAIPPDMLQKNLPPNSKFIIDLQSEAWRHIPTNIRTFRGLGFVLGGFLPSSQLLQQFMYI